MVMITIKMAGAASDILGFWLFGWFRGLRGVCDGSDSCGMRGICLGT